MTMRALRRADFGESEEARIIDRRERERLYQRERRMERGCEVRDDPWVTKCPVCRTKSWDIGTFRDANGQPYLETFCVECLRRKSRVCPVCRRRLDSLNGRIKHCSAECANVTKRALDIERHRKRRSR